MTHTAHYETLGVAPTATAKEIHIAYRRKISAAHTDRAGGDNDLAARLNVAYEVLIDPERRKHYDATGANKVDDVLAQAEQLLVGKAMQWLQANDNGNLIQGVLSALCQDLNNVVQNHGQGEHLKQRLERALGRLRYKGPKTDLVRAAIEGQVKNIEEKFLLSIKQEETLKRAIELCQDYEYDFIEQVTVYGYETRVERSHPGFFGGQMPKFGL
jgi:curved DNA-binding protein CbpA